MRRIPPARPKRPAPPAFPPSKTSVAIAASAACSRSCSWLPLSVWICARYRSLEVLRRQLARYLIDAEVFEDIGASGQRVARGVISRYGETDGENGWNVPLPVRRGEMRSIARNWLPRADRVTCETRSQEPRHCLRAAPPRFGTAEAASNRRHW